jgi:hypothetical protein
VPERFYGSANGAMLSPTATATEVASGRFVDLVDPQPDDLLIDDVARGLAFTCRYGGQVRNYYSVAEHSVLVHDLLRWMGATVQTCVAGLWHDAAEAYLGDLISPLKFALREDAGESAYDVLSARFDDAIVERFGLDPVALASEQVHLADLWALRIEARSLTASGGRHWRWPGDLPNDGHLPHSVDWFGHLGPDGSETLWRGRALAYAYPEGPRG